MFGLGDLGPLQSRNLDLQPVLAFGLDADFPRAQRIKPLAQHRDRLVERLRTRVALHLEQKFGAALEIEPEPDRLVQRVEGDAAGQQTGHNRAHPGGAAGRRIFSREIPDEKSEETE